MAALVVLALISVIASVLVINLQLRLMQVAGTAQTLAAAGNHAALNLANALGALLGGLVIAAATATRPRRSSAPGSPCWDWASWPCRCSCTAATTPSGPPPPPDRGPADPGVRRMPRSSPKVPT